MNDSQFNFPPNKTKNLLTTWQPSRKSVYQKIKPGQFKFTLTLLLFDRLSNNIPGEGHFGRNSIKPNVFICLPRTYSDIFFLLQYQHFNQGQNSIICCSFACRCWHCFCLSPINRQKDYLLLSSFPDVPLEHQCE